MRIRWTPPAARDMQGISDYLKDHSPRYRQPTMRKLYEKIRALKETPNIRRPGRIEGTRELLFSPMPYIVVYRVIEHTIEIYGASGTPRRAAAVPVNLLKTERSDAAV
jgi:toxin ParE1/3/4